MAKTTSVLFVFSNKCVARIVKEPILLNDIDCIISALPGVSLKSLHGSIECIELEEALVKFGITQRMISESARAYSLLLLAPEVMIAPLRILSSTACEAVRLALLNHVALITHNAFAFEALFKALVGNGMVKAQAFQALGRYRLIERLDIRTLLQINLTFWPHLVHICAQNGVILSGIASSDRLALVKNLMRDFLLLGYKGLVLLKRSFYAPKRIKESPCKIAVFVRARTELVAAEPLLRTSTKQGDQNLIFVDDLIKSPNGTLAARESSWNWVGLHSFSRPFDVIRIFVRCISLRYFASKRAIAQYPSRVAKMGFLGCPEIAQKVLYTAFASVPELFVHSLQIRRAFNRFKPKTVISFDTVDRWGALQGDIARSAKINTVMIQNTAVDDIMYPWPLSMDQLVVSNERLRQIFIDSGADPHRVHAFGLPLQDELLRKGDIQLQILKKRAAQGGYALRILLATQPFVQEFDYNHALIEDLVVVCHELDFPVEWVLKPHPRESSAKYVALRQMLTARKIQVTLFAEPFEKALQGVDIVLSRTSTGLEFAALGGVPGIAHLDRYPIDIVDRLDYLKSPVTHKSFDRNELSDLLKRFAPKMREETLNQFSKARSKYIDKFFPGQGRATQRVLNLIKSESLRC